MRYTPVELRHVRVGRALRRLQRGDETDKLLEDVADSFEDGLARARRARPTSSRRSRSSSTSSSSARRCWRTRSSRPSSAAERGEGARAARGGADRRRGPPARRARSRARRRPSASGCSPRRGASRRCCARRSGWSRRRRRRARRPPSTARRAEDWPKPRGHARVPGRRSCRRSRRSADAGELPLAAETTTAPGAGPRLRLGVAWAREPTRLSSASLRALPAPASSAVTARVEGARRRCARGRQGERGGRPLLADALGCPRGDVEIVSGHGVPGQDRRARRASPRRDRAAARTASGGKGPAVTTIDTDEFRTLLEEERARLTQAPSSSCTRRTRARIEDELGEIGSGGTDNHLGDTASATFDRELDRASRRARSRRSTRSTPRSQRIDDGTYGTCEVCGKPIGAERLRAHPVGAALHRRPAARRVESSRRARRPRRLVDERARARLGRRALARGRARGSGPGLAAVARRRGRRRPGDEARRHEHARARRVGARRRAALDPPRPELGHRVRPLLAARRRSSRSSPAVAVVWMVVFFARSGSRHPVLPAALGLLIGGSLSNLVDRIRLHHVTDFIDLALVAGVQPRGQLHRDRRRDPARARSSPPTASRGRRGARSTSPRGERAASRRGGRRAARPVPRRRTSARARRPSARSSAGALVDGVARAEELPARRAGRRSSVPAEAAAADAAGAAGPPRSPGRTSTCWSSTSRPGSSCTRARATRAGRSCDALAGTIARRRRPSGPGIVHRLDRDTSGLIVVARSEEAHRAAAGARPRARARAHVPRARARPAALADAARIEAPIGRDRERPDAHLARHGHAARGGHALRGRAAARPEHALLRVTARDRAGCTRSACTSPRSTCRWSATATYGVAEPGSRGSSCTRRELAFPHPFTGERIETRSRAAGRPRGRATSQRAQPSELPRERLRASTYWRASASRSSASASGASVGKCAEPALTSKPPAARRAPAGRRCPSRKRREEALARVPVGLEQQRRRTRRRPCGRRRPSRAASTTRSDAMRCSTRSPSMWPSVSLISLKRSRSRKTSVSPWS